ncbi:MAG: AAA family ATPase [Anaerolineales bacterium]|nr:AAA family ATPase [Anaerolineales bacterium]
MQKRITDDLHALLDVIPPEIGVKLTAANRTDELLEIILDLGRVPTARYIDGEVVLADHEITRAEIDYVVTRIGDFDADNRAGMERTLHRISAIRNRRAQIVGLTCRVGRAVYGTIDIIQDIIDSGKSVLMLGRPGIGKTTMLREAARTLAEKKRVVIVDTSNEIGGDGDVPHPAVGRARRMQVAQPTLQHEVMIEAVENHNPEIIVIDEIGRELEAMAARTIAERGVQLIGTAHGNTLENLMLNPTLADLIGGIESVTLSDEEARRRGTQKTVLERRAPPTFDVLIEIQAREQLAVHHDVATAVDALLRGRPRAPEVRSVVDGQVKIEQPPDPQPPGRASRAGHRTAAALPTGTVRTASAPRSGEPNGAPTPAQSRLAASAEAAEPHAGLEPVRIYAYGIARNRLDQAIRHLRVPAQLVDLIDEAQTIVTLKTYYRQRQRPIADAEERGLPIYVLRANTTNQIENFLSDLFSLRVQPGGGTNEAEDAIDETQRAIQQVLTGAASYDLPPAAPHIRRLQHDLARKANLISHSYGKEPRRWVRLFRD